MFNELTGAEYLVTGTRQGVVIILFLLSEGWGAGIPGSGQLLKISAPDTDNSCRTRPRP